MQRAALRLSFFRVDFSTVGRNPPRALSQSSAILAEIVQMEAPGSPRPRALASFCKTDPSLWIADALRSASGPGRDPKETLRGWSCRVAKAHSFGVLGLFRLPPVNVRSGSNPAVPAKRAGYPCPESGSDIQTSHPRRAVTRADRPAYPRLSPAAISSGRSGSGPRHPASQRRAARPTASTPHRPRAAPTHAAATRQPERYLSAPPPSARGATAPSAHPTPFRCDPASRRSPPC